MPSNAVENLRYHDIEMRDYEKEIKKIKISTEFISSGYTRYGWDGGMNIEAFKISISKKCCGNKEVKYIVNTLRNIDNYCKVEVSDNNGFYEFSVLLETCYGNFYQVKEVDKALFDIKEEIKIILKVFSISSFELIGMLYYAPSVLRK